MADQTSMLAIVILAVGVSVHFSLHKVEEGYVGVYYRVSEILYSTNIIPLYTIIYY